jgi:hypothetical protein
MQIKWLGKSDRDLNSYSFRVQFYCFGDGFAKPLRQLFRGRDMLTKSVRLGTNVHFTGFEKREGFCFAASRKRQQ